MINETGGLKPTQGFVVESDAAGVVDEVRPCIDNHGANPVNAKEVRRCEADRPCSHNENVDVDFARGVGPETGVIGCGQEILPSRKSV
jgi:hypothetical protein